MNRKPNIPVLFLIFFVFCSRDKNPVGALNSDNGKGDLCIQTENSIYTWVDGGSNNNIIIHGTLVNNSKTRYFSQVGDWMGEAEQDLLFIAGNSAAMIEKFLESDKSWHKSDITALLIEGSRFVTLEPSKIHSVYGHLSVKPGQQQSGTFRIRIDY
ncbi:hypothetical protein JXQ31_21000 [candidate division KSB1 bacterium]|nr:hypothetical protein [candidate division KSB1 bacterium]